MRDLILYLKHGPVKCAGCEAVKSKMTAAGMDFEERDVEHLSLDAVADKTIADALHAYWWHNDHMPVAAPVLISRAFRELWDSEDLEDLGDGRELSNDRPA